MKTYIKFLVKLFLKSFIFVFFIIFSFVSILNILSEIEFFQNISSISSYLPIYLSLLNSPSIIFEMFPFIFLISTQFFFIQIFEDNQIEIFKYSGLKNINIISILTIISFLLGVFIIIFYYNISSNLKNIYLELKNNFSSDDKYLAVVTKNGLWIKDTIDNKVNIVHAYKIDNNSLSNSFISQFDKEFNLEQNIVSENVNITDNTWILENSKIYINNSYSKIDKIEFKSNFNYKKIQSLFSNLSSLSLLKLIELRKNYIYLNYSVIEVNLQILKILTYPLVLSLMTILSAIIMFNTKRFKGSIFKISIGLFLSVIIYYINNFFNIMGKSEQISIIISILIPIILLSFSNILLMRNINEK